jgi:hypothetical protein
MKPAMKSDLNSLSDYIASKPQNIDLSLTTQVPDSLCSTYCYSLSDGEVIIDGFSDAGTVLSLYLPLE